MYEIYLHRIYDHENRFSDFCQICNQFNKIPPILRTYHWCFLNLRMKWVYCWSIEREISQGQAVSDFGILLLARNHVIIQFTHKGKQTLFCSLEPLQTCIHLIRGNFKTKNKSQFWILVTQSSWNIKSENDIHSAGRTFDINYYLCTSSIPFHER